MQLNKNIYIVILSFLILVTGANALDMCDNTPFVETNCKMVTPSINCSVYNYTIYNSINQSIIEESSLSKLNGTIYFFNFTKPTGDYLIKLCDGTTRELRVGKEDDEMGWNAIVLSLGIMTALFLFLGYTIKDVGLKTVKLLFFMLGMINVFMMGLLPFVISSNPGNTQAFKPVAMAYFGINVVLLVALVYLYSMHLLTNNVLKKKIR